MKNLNKQSRILLNALIHSEETNWWSVVPDKLIRNQSLDILLKLGFIKINDMKECSVTALGIRSNQKAKDANLI